MSLNFHIFAKRRFQLAKFSVTKFYYSQGGNALCRLISQCLSRLKFSNLAFLLCKSHIVIKRSLSYKLDTYNEFIQQKIQVVLYFMRPSFFHSMPTKLYNPCDRRIAENLEDRLMKKPLYKLSSLLNFSELCSTSLNFSFSILLSTFSQHSFS